MTSSLEGLLSLFTTEIFSFLLMKCIGQAKVSLYQLQLSYSKKKNGHQYKLQRNSQFNISAVNLVYNRTVIVSFQGHKIWNILQDRLKKIDSIGAFKMAIKS